MGYCYQGGKLVCDGCGTPGAVKRLCSAWVTAANGQRSRWCPPPALCGGCFAKEGGTKGVHARCKAAAAQDQAREDARKARLADGELFVSTALSGAGWHVPAGQVGAWFTGLGKAGTWLLIPTEVYDRKHKAKGLELALSDFPGMSAWEDNPDVRRAREAGTVLSYTIVPLSYNPRNPSPQFEPFELSGTDFGEVSREATRRLGHDQRSIVRTDTLGARA